MWDDDFYERIKYSDSYYELDYNDYRFYRERSDNVCYIDYQSILQGKFNKYSERLKFLVNCVIDEFRDTGLICYDVKKFKKFPSIRSEFSRSKYDEIIVRLEFLDTRKNVNIIYNSSTNEISGLVYISLGDRDLYEITEEEITILEREILLWIMKNVGED